MPKAQTTNKRSTTAKTGANGSAANARTTASGKQHKTLNDLLEDGLKDMLSAEKQLVEALPEMVQAADNEELQDAFRKHLEQTKRHVERLQKVMTRLNITVSEEEKCEAMEGLIREGKEIIERYESSPVRDSALIIAAQKVEHYEIASYGSLAQIARTLGNIQGAELLEATLAEEKGADQVLSMLAMSGINQEASVEEEAAEEE